MITKDQISAALLESDQAFAPTLAELEAAQSTAEGAQATAGDQLAEEEEAAEQAAATAASDYQAFLDSWQAGITSANSQIAAVSEPSSQQSLIDAIQPVGAITVADLTLEDVQTAIDSLIGQINTNVVTPGVAALSGLDEQLTGGAIGDLKTAASAITDAVQIQRTNAPPLEDVDALTAVAFAAIEGAITS